MGKARRPAEEGEGKTRISARSGRGVMNTAPTSQPVRSQPVRHRLHRFAARTCARCGSAYLPAGWKQRYCAACGPAARRDRRSRYNKRHRLAHLAEEKAKRRLKYQATQQRVDAPELERLRLPENRLEALAFGTEKKCVCLNCGLICDNLSRHVSACPVKAQSSDSYRCDWGYNRTNPLVSAEWRKQRSSILKDSEKYQAAQKKLRPKFITAADAFRQLRSTAKTSGEAFHYGPMRAEATHRRSVTQRGRPHLNGQKVSDSVIARLLAQDLTTTERAKRAGLSPRGFRVRARKLGWDGGLQREKRQVVIDYISDLGVWLRSHPQEATLDQALQRHGSGLREDEPSNLFRKFNPFLPSLEAELKANPAAIGKLKRSRNGRAAITLASKVFKRAHSVAAPAASPAAVAKTVGRPADKRKIFVRAKQMHSEGKKWAHIAKELVPDEFRADWRAAKERIRTGVRDLKGRKKPRKKS